MTVELPVGTKTRLLDVAERLFAEKGFDAASLREITAAAGVNLASVNYHFRSKDDLIRAVLARRIEPVNKARLELLEKLEAEAGGAPVELERLMEAFYSPLVELFGHPENRFRPLFGRIFGEPGKVREFFMDYMEPVARRYATALARTLPQLPAPELMWRLFFSAGILAFTMSASRVLMRLSDGHCTPEDVPATTRRMVDFACAGLRAPVSGDVCTEKQ